MRSTLIEANQNLATLIEKSPLPILVDFWAPWCGPCKRLSPIIDTLAEKWAGKLQIIKVNVDDHREETDAHGIKSIPTLLLFDKDKKQIDTLRNIRTLEELEAKLAPISS